MRAGAGMDCFLVQKEQRMVGRITGKQYGPGKVEPTREGKATGTSLGFIQWDRRSNGIF